MNATSPANVSPYIATYSHHTDDVTAETTISIDGRRACVIVRNGTRKMTVTMRHESGGTYTDDDRGLLANLAVARFHEALNAGDHDGQTTTRRGRIAALELVHIREHAPPTWWYPRIQLARQTGRWYFLRVGWINTAHTFGIRLHQPDTPTGSTA